MASVSPAGSIYGSIVAKNKGIGGLATGLDTESLMEALTAATRAKLAKQGQLKQVAQWKQTAYRSAVSALSAFKDKHLTFNSKNTNIMSSSFFTSIKGTPSSDKIKVTTTANSTLSDITIKSVEKLAVAHEIKGKDSIKQSLVGGDVSALIGTKSFVGETLTLTVDGAQKTIKLDSLQGSSDLEGDLQTLINGAFGTKTVNGTSVPVVNVDFDGSNFELQNDAGRVTINRSSDLLGFEEAQSNRVDPGSTKLFQVNGLGVGENDTFKFNINGYDFEAKGTDTVETLMSRINTSGAGVRMTYSSVTDTFTITSKTTGVANKIDMKDTDGKLMSSFFGAKSATSVTGTDLYTSANYTAGSAFDSTSVNDACNAIINDNALTFEEKKVTLNGYFAGLDNFNFSLTIGNTTKTVKGDFSALKAEALGILEDNEANGTNNTIAIAETDIVSAFNKGIDNMFGVGTSATIGFQINGGIISLTSGVGAKVEMKAGSGSDALDFLGFGIGKSYSNAVSIANKPSIDSSAAIDSAFELVEGKTYSFNLKIGNTEKTVSYTVQSGELAALQSSEHAGYLARKLDEVIYNAFKDEPDKAGVESGGNINMLVAFTVDADGNAKLVTDRSLDVSVSNSGLTGTDDIELLGAFKITPANNKSDNLSTVKLGDLGITSGTLSIQIGNDTTTARTVNYNANMTLDQFVSAVGSDVAKIVDGKLVIDGGEYLDISDSNSNVDGVLQALFGKTAGYKTEYASMNESGGTNAEIILGDGSVMSSSTNTFDINGTKVEALEETSAPITIKMSSDPDALIDKIKDFIADYNALIATLNGMVKEEKKSEYQPLTEEQRAEMSTTEIEKWEAEAQKGILRNDPEITRILSNLRTSIYSGVGENDLSLYGIGITTVSILTGGYGRDGQIELTEDGEQKLRDAIINDPDSVREIFTNAKDGLATKLNTAIDRAIDTSSDLEKRGTLITIAGTGILTGNNKSSLSLKIEAYDEAIARLKTRLETEYNRYWKQFSNLETAIQRMSAQSSWLSEFSS